MEWMGKAGLPEIVEYWFIRNTYPRIVCEFARLGPGILYIILISRTVFRLSRAPISTGFYTCVRKMSRMLLDYLCNYVVLRNIRKRRTKRLHTPHLPPCYVPDLDLSTP